MTHPVHGLTPPTTLLRLPEVCRRLGIARSEVYRRVQAGLLPAPVKIGKRASAWVEAEIEAAAQRMIRASRAREGAV
jgi:prophage regulatory protein